MNKLCVTAFYSGFAASQCGKPPPYRIDAIWILRLCYAWLEFRRRSLSNKDANPVKQSLTALGGGRAAKHKQSGH